MREKELSELDMLKFRNHNKTVTLEEIKRSGSTMNEEMLRKTKENVICKDFFLQKENQRTHVQIICQKNGELLNSTSEKDVPDSYELALDLLPCTMKQIDKESDIEIQQLINEILQTTPEEGLSIYGRIIARLIQSIIFYLLETKRNDGLPVRILSILVTEDIDNINMLFTHLKNDSEAKKQWSILTKTLEFSVLESLWKSTIHCIIEYFLKDKMNIHQDIMSKNSISLYITGQKMESNFYNLLCSIIIDNKFINMCQKHMFSDELKHDRIGLIKRESLKKQSYEMKNDDPLYSILKSLKINTSYILFMEWMKNADRYVSQNTIKKLVDDTRDVTLWDLCFNWPPKNIITFKNYKKVNASRYSCKKINFSRYIAFVRKENLKQKQLRIADLLNSNEEKIINEGANTFNQYVGSDDILYVQSTVPMPFLRYHIYELKQHSSILDAKQHFFLDPVCVDVYIRIRKNDDDTQEI